MQSKNDIALLEKLCSIHAPSGSEDALKDFLLDYIKTNQDSWQVQPEVFSGENWQNNIILVFGNPKTAAFAHIDSIGFTVRYENQLVPIGSPDFEKGYVLVGEDDLGPVRCTLNRTAENRALYDFPRGIQTGTTLTWEPNFRHEPPFITSPYMDNRLGVYNLLKVAETLENGILVFSTWEEHGGGSVPYLIKFIYEKYGVRQALISDITWVTEGVVPGKGVAISIRDRNIPRRLFVNNIIDIANKSGINFQREVEGGGSSDGREIQESPYPIDWCFIGAAEDKVHSPNEQVHIDDINSMIALYKELFQRL